MFCVDHPIISGYDFHLKLTAGLMNKLMDSRPYVTLDRSEPISCTLHEESRTLVFRAPGSCSGPLENLVVFDGLDGPCIAHARVPVYNSFACTYRDGTAFRLKFSHRVQQATFAVERGECVSWMSAFADPVVQRGYPDIDFYSLKEHGKLYEDPGVYVCPIEELPSYLKPHIHVVVLPPTVSLGIASPEQEDEDESERVSPQRESSVFRTWENASPRRARRPDAAEPASLIAEQVPETQYEEVDESQALLQGARSQSSRDMGVGGQVALFTDPPSSPRECVTLFRKDVDSLGDRISKWFAQCAPSPANRAVMAESLFRTLSKAVFTSKSMNLKRARGAPTSSRSHKRRRDVSMDHAQEDERCEYLGVTFCAVSHQWHLCTVMFHEQQQDTPERATVSRLRMIKCKSQRRYTKCEDTVCEERRGNSSFILLDDALVTDPRAPTGKATRHWHEYHALDVRPQENEPFTRVQMRRLLGLAMSLNIEREVNNIDDVMRLYDDVVRTHAWDEHLDKKACVETKYDKTNDMSYIVRQSRTVAPGYSDVIKSLRVKVVQQATDIFKRISQAQKRAARRNGTSTQDIDAIADEHGEDVAGVIMMTPFEPA